MREDSAQRWLGQNSRREREPGFQACVAYGAAEFSRDTDLMVLAQPANLAALGLALADLEAEVIASPPFKAGVEEGTSPGGAIPIVGTNAMVTSVARGSG